MAYSYEVLADVKNSVKTKLRELGAFVDEELPDYIMVMVANKKKRESMNNDLQLFLGSKTEQFTEWLHVLLENLGKSEVKKKRSLSPKVPRSDKREKISKRVSRSTRTDRDRSRSSVQRNVINKLSSRTVSPLAQTDTDFINVRAEENDFRDETVESSFNTDISTPQEQRRIVSTSSLPGKGNIIPEDSSPAMRSIIQPPQKSRINQEASHEMRSSGMLLKRAMNEAEASIEKPPIVHIATAEKPPLISTVATSTRPSAIVSGRKRVSQPISSSTNEADDDVPPLKSTKFVVTLNEITAPVESKPIKVSVKSRLGPRIAFPVLPGSNAAAAVDDNDNNGQWTMLDAREILLAKKLQRGQQQVRLQQQQQQQHLYTLPTPSPPMVVSLSESLDEDDTFLDEAAVLHTNVEGDNDDTNKSSDLALKRQNIPSTLERCKYWPNCRNGPSCHYLHPKQECKAFPNCTFGERCHYMHPPCRYGAVCTRPNCAYSHTGQVLTSQATGISGGLQPAIVCRFIPNCKNVACQFLHPEALPCRFGAACMHRSTSCTFSHPPLLPSSNPNSSKLEKSAIPASHQLKWVKPQLSIKNVSPVATGQLVSPVGDVAPAMSSTSEMIV